MSKRSLVMLASEYDPLKFKAEGSYLSEKLDGVRAIWLPFTRGMNFKDVPWANTAKDDRNYVCSGLWTRRGKVIVAPSWWLDALPQDMPLDGELYSGRGNFNKTVGTVRKLEPDQAEWAKIVYKVFDIPGYVEFFRTAQIREGGRSGEPAYEVYFRSDWLNRWPDLRGSQFYHSRRFNEVVAKLTKGHWKNPEIVEPLSQMLLPISREAAENLVNDHLTTITESGGEGLMLRRPHSIWSVSQTRSEDLAKVKKLHDAEAEVVGFCYGVGKYQGMIGAIRVKFGSVTFDLSGFTDSERATKFDYLAEANRNPGKFTDASVSEKFPIGSVVTFAYNELTSDGVPRFARYLRPHSGM